MDIEMLMKLLGGGGPPGTADQPWNPASKLVGGMPVMPRAPGAQGPQGAPQSGVSAGGNPVMNAIMPNTMKTIGAGKGGASG